MSRLAFDTRLASGLMPGAPKVRIFIVQRFDLRQRWRCCRQCHTIASDVGGGGGALQQAQTGRPIGPRPARRRIPQKNPRPLRFRFFGGHRCVSAR